MIKAEAIDTINYIVKAEYKTEWVEPAQAPKPRNFDNPFPHNFSNILKEEYLNHSQDFLNRYLIPYSNQQHLISNQLTIQAPRIHYPSPFYPTIKVPIDDIERLKPEKEQDSSPDSYQTDNRELWKEWSDKRISYLKKLVIASKYDWKKIAKKFNKSSHTNILPENLRLIYKDATTISVPLRVLFTHQEDLKIVKYIEIYGMDWPKIAKHFCNRTGTMLKNRYYSHIRKKGLTTLLQEELRQKDFPTKTEAIPFKNLENNSSIEEIRQKEIPVKAEFAPLKSLENTVKAEHVNQLPFNTALIRKPMDWESLIQPLIINRLQRFE